MKQTKRLFALAALALAVAAMTGCTKEAETSVAEGKVVTSTTTVSLNDGTKALTNEGVKTFAAGDKIAVVYRNTSSELEKTTVTLTRDDISNEGKTARITVDMIDPSSNGTLRIIYPAAMATDAGAVKYTALANQDGTLATIASTLDLALYEGTLDGTVLPASLPLENPLAICEFTIKSASGGTDHTSSITTLYIGDGTNSYYLSDLEDLSSIWVAMKPVANSSYLTFHATDGTNKYEKEITGKTLAAGNMYHIAVGTTTLPEGALFGTFSVSANKQVHFSQGNLRATFDGSNWTWAFAAHQYDYIGNAGGNTMVTSSSPYISGNGTVDLFGWVGASSTAFTEGTPGMYGVSASTTDENYGTSTSDALKADWGTLDISNGGGANQWQTLTGGSGGEWQYIFNNTSVRPATRFAKAYLFGTTHGVILFPDHYTHPTDVDAPTGVNATDNTSWDANNYEAGDWAKMEAAGAVFLPAAGRRSGSSVSDVGSRGRYWSSSPSSSIASAACGVNFQSDNVGPANQYSRRNGYSVRLVCPVE